MGTFLIAAVSTHSGMRLPRTIRIPPRMSQTSFPKVPGRYAAPSSFVVRECTHAGLIAASPRDAYRNTRMCRGTRASRDRFRYDAVHMEVKTLLVEDDD